MDLGDIKVLKIKQAVSPEISKSRIKFNKEGKNNLCGTYGKNSKKTLMQHQKSAYKL